MRPSTIRIASLFQKKYCTSEVLSTSVLALCVLPLASWNDGRRRGLGLRGIVLGVVTLGLARTLTLRLTNFLRVERRAKQHLHCTLRDCIIELQQLHAISVL